MIFMLEIGKPVKIIGLAKNEIELLEIKVDEDIEIKFNGMCQGEKVEKDPPL